MLRPIQSRWSASLVAVFLVACGGGDADDSSAASATASTSAADVQETAFPENVYWGDTHVHTAWSADAGMDGAVRDPFDAYRFALGEEVESNSGLPAQLSRPYDWFAVTDHSDGMGTINQIVDRNPEMMADPMLARWADSINKGTEEAMGAAKSELIRAQSNEELPAQIMDPKWMRTAWERTIEAAEQFYQPGRFTTFIGYEWTVNAQGGNNLHRNVIFRDGSDRALQVIPQTTFQSQDVETLWDWMEAYEQSTGGQVLAIPHNGNMSNGRMFEETRFDGSPLTAEYVAERARWEPLYEVTQIKGQSESHPELSPDDEFAAWDLWDDGNLIGVNKSEGDLQFEYWRQALQSGLRLEDEYGTNPFQYGANGATDTHTGLSTADEDNFFGKFKTLEPRAERWEFPLIEGVDFDYEGWQQAASGVMGVWATANTREAIWDAMKRRETYATTGPRMTLRFFGGWDFADGDLSGDMAQAGYDRGVPMGGSLDGAEGEAPTFILAATKDPEGANLDRIQVIKGFLRADGTTGEAIYDVAWSGDRQPGADGDLPPVGNTVDLETAEYTNTIGAAERQAVWTDPDFDPSQPAVYYVRVLEIPTPRWTLYDKVRFGVEMPDRVPLVHQERGFSSPIWYNPAQ
jgi:hypothetical protein